MLKLGKCLDGEDESDKVIPWTALASSQSKIEEFPCLVHKLSVTLTALQYKLQ